MIHSYRLKRKTVTASLGVLALSLGLLGDVFADEIRIKPQAKPEQPAQSEVNVPAHKEAMASSIFKVVKPQTFKLPGGFKLVIKKLEVTKIDKLELMVNLKGQMKKKNPVPIPGNEYISATGTIKVRFGVATKGGQLCTPSMSIISVNFKNVQNDVEQAAKNAVNDFLLSQLPNFCVPIKV